MLRFTAYGVPQPKGSTKAFLPKGWKRPIITADNTKTKPWAEAVKHAALDALKGAPPILAPAVLVLRFYLPRPTSAPKRIIEPAKKPDLDKLVRTAKDALTQAGVYHDDGQVVATFARKDFAGGVMDPCGQHGIPRVEIAVGLSTITGPDASPFGIVPELVFPLPVSRSLWAVE